MSKLKATTPEEDFAKLLNDLEEQLKASELPEPAQKPLPEISDPRLTELTTGKEGVTIKDEQIRTDQY